MAEIIRIGEGLKLATGNTYFISRGRVTHCIEDGVMFIRDLYGKWYKMVGQNKDILAKEMGYVHGV